MRLLAIKYGATIAYSEEIIDKKILQTTRVENPRLGTVEYNLPSGSTVFATVPGERVVFQMGTNDPERAVQAALHVQRDVRAIDVNMGCPKHFSVHAGMGAGLLTKPELAAEIIKQLKASLSCPVTCKIRLLPEPKQTLDLVAKLETAGVDAIAVHGRQVPDRSRFEADLDGIRYVKEHAKVPIIHNADIFLYQDIDKMKAITLCDSVMIARGAQWNCSIFRKEGVLPVYNVMRDYVDIAKLYENRYANTKYCLTSMIKPAGKTEVARKLFQCKDYDELELIINEFSKVPSLAHGYEVPEKLQPRTSFLLDGNLMLEQKNPKRIRLE